MTTSRWLLWRYYLFRITNSAGFYLPVAVLYLQDQEYGLGFVGFSYAVFGFATLAAEIPTGYLGDLIGRRGSLAIGSAMRALVLGAYTLVDSPLAILVLHVLWATGRSFRSGTQDAWLYELLAVHLDEDQFSRVEGRGSAILLVTSAGGAIAGSLLYTVNVGYPFLVNAGLALLGIPILLTFPAVESGGGEDDRFTFRDALATLRLQVGRPQVRWLVAYAALFHALFLVTGSTSNRPWNRSASRSPGSACCTPGSRSSRRVLPPRPDGWTTAWAPGSCSPSWSRCTAWRTGASRWFPHS